MKWLNDTNEFNYSGCLGLIIIVLYFIIIYINAKVKKYNFKFSIIVLLSYLVLVFYMVIRFENGITYGMRYWFQPFLLCIVVDGIGYTIKKRKRKK